MATNTNIIYKWIYIMVMEAQMHKMWSFFCRTENLMSKMTTKNYNLCLRRTKLRIYNLRTLLRRSFPQNLHIYIYFIQIQTHINTWLHETHLTIVSYTYTPPMGFKPTTLPSLRSVWGLSVIWVKALCYWQCFSNGKLRFSHLPLQILACCRILLHRQEHCSSTCSLVPPGAAPP